MAVADTIFALASGAGVSGVAIIRVSGPAAGEALTALTGDALPAPRQAALARFIDPASGEVLDSGLVLWFENPNSYTGEDVAELHIHGGLATIEAMLAALGRFPGCRLAERGEFTRRAFDHGKLDLTEIEGLADLVAAETEAQRRQALRQLDGALGQVCENWREELLTILARLEAWIDFPDEELPPDLFTETNHQILQIFKDVSRYIEGSQTGERIRQGISIAIVGPPNAGKSSLLNYLAGREAAIVAETAGTTRDVVEVHCSLAGFAVSFADTAGLREAAETIEAEGIRRARATADQADLCLVVNAVEPSGELPAFTHGISSVTDRNTLHIVNKSDLLTHKSADGGPSGAFFVSVKNGENMAALVSAITDRVRNLVGNQEIVPLTRARHREALTHCADALGKAAAGTEIELIAEDIRAAVRALGRITGRVDIEDVLDRLFGEFCIGK